PRRFPAGGIYSLLCLLSPPPRAWGISSTGVEGSVLASPPRPSHSPARPKCNGGGSLARPSEVERRRVTHYPISNRQRLPIRNRPNQLRISKIHFSNRR